MNFLKSSYLVGILAFLLPITANAFGFGMTNDDYYGPWGPYGPYGPYSGNPPQSYPPPAFAPQHIPPHGPPPGARDVRGMWGSGPLMQWGSRDKDQTPRKIYKPYEKLREPWEWSKPWPSMLDPKNSQAKPVPGEAVSVEAEGRPTAPKVESNFSNRGKVYPGWQRYQEADRPGPGPGQTQ